MKNKKGCEFCKAWHKAFIESCSNSPQSVVDSLRTGKNTFEGNYRNSNVTEDTFNLSDEIHKDNENYNGEFFLVENYLDVDDVKLFIKKVEEDVIQLPSGKITHQDVIEIIKNRAGGRLVK